MWESTQFEIEHFAKEHAFLNDASEPPEYAWDCPACGQYHACSTNVQGGYYTDLCSCGHKYVVQLDSDYEAGGW